MRYHLTPTRMATITKTQKRICVSKDMEKLEPWYTGGGNVTWCSHNGKQFGSSSHSETENYQKFHSQVYTQELTARTSTVPCTPMFTAALLTSAKRQRQPMCPSPDEWIHKMWSRQTMEYCSTIKRKAIPTHAIQTWMNPEDITLSEMRQSQKDKYFKLLLV